MEGFFLPCGETPRSASHPPALTNDIKELGELGPLGFSKIARFFRKDDIG